MDIERNAILEAQKGNYKHQKLLFNKYKSSWYMTCLRYMGNRADADDAIQNGMINIFTKISQYNPDMGNFSSWSTRIMVNDCIMLLRKRKRVFVTEEISEYDKVYDENETPIEALSRKEILQLIQKLPEGYRMVFNMYIIEGYSHKEIAEQLNISEGTSKSQLFKARRFLKEALETII